MPGIDFRTAPLGALDIPSRPASTRDPGPFSPAKLAGWLFVLDAAAIFVAQLLAACVSLAVDAGATSSHIPHMMTVLIGISIIMITMRSFDLYDFAVIKNRNLEIRLVFLAMSVAFMALLAITFAYSDGIEFSRAWFLSWYIGSVALVHVGRLSTWHALRSLAAQGKLRRRVAIYGQGRQADRLLESLESEEDPWISIIGLFDDRQLSRGEVTSAVRGDIRQLVGLCRRNKVDDVIIALPWSAEKRILEVIGELENLPVNIKAGPDMINFTLPNATVEKISGLELLDVSPHPLAGGWAVLKSIEDYVVGSILLVLLAPVLATIAILIKLTSPGPIFYRQARFGINNCIFHVMKFRTMYHNRPVEYQTLQATKGDPRVTPLGRFLRRTSLDELPQLFNVLGGSMSLVGPRPHAIDHNELYGDVIDRYFVRHRVKPGITGWAQVNGYRGETDVTEKMQKRVEFDIAYIEKWSPLLDLIIIFRTMFVVISQKNAY